MDHTDVKREPLLSGADIVEIYYANSEYGGEGTNVDALNAVRDFYEAMITIGELMVAKTVCKDKWCGTKIADGMNFCPNCGAKIIE